MTLFEKLIYLADYIDDTRLFPDCVLLRRCFFDAEPKKMSYEERLRHLDSTLILSFDMTINGIKEEGGRIAVETIEAAESLKSKMNK